MLGSISDSIDEFIWRNLERTLEADTIMTFIPTAVRFLCHIPAFMFGITGINHYNFVKRHAGILLLPPLNSSHGVLYESLSGPGGIALAVWNFITFLPAFGASGPVLFFLGCVDTIFVVLIATWLHYEKSFIGMNNPQCNQVPRNTTADDTHLIFFERAWQTNVTSSDFGVVLCKSFMTNWYVGLVVTILYSISALACFLGTGIEADDLFSIIIFPMRAPYKLILFAYHSLPDRVQTSIPYYTRYIKEWFIHKKDSSDVKLHLLPSTRTQEKGKDEYTTLLTQLLHKRKSSKYDILQGIAREVDYIDLVNLSLVSKTMRKTIFPPAENDDEEDERQLRFNSCLGKIKSTCWICAIQICQDCSTPKFVRESTVSHHMKLCQSKCTSCFRKSFMSSNKHNPYLPQTHLQKTCTCNDGRRPMQERLMYELARDGQERRLCRGCVVFSQEELVNMREKRDQAVYNSLAKQPMACESCKAVLSREGPRWWVCSICKGECKGGCHPRWWDWKEDV